MTLTKRIRERLEKLTGTHIYRWLPRGIDYLHDIGRTLPNYQVNVVVDVGANVGQSARVYLARFPSSHIYCFEPVSSTFRQLQDNLSCNDRVDCYQLALGSSTGTREMILQDSSDLCFLLDQSNEHPASDDMPRESVEVATLDDFCDTNRIDKINYLKVDTEGGDLDVLKGAVNMLDQQRIDLLNVEVGMNPRNKRHVPLESMKTFLESHGYCIFGLYEQMHEWPHKEPQLRRANPVFMSQAMIDKNRGAFREWE